MGGRQNPLTQLRAWLPAACRSRDAREHETTPGRLAAHKSAPAAHLGADAACWQQLRTCGRSWMPAALLPEKEVLAAHHGAGGLGVDALWLCTGNPTCAARRCLLPVLVTSPGPFSAAWPTQHRHHSAAGRHCMVECQQLWEDCCTGEQSSVPTTGAQHFSSPWVGIQRISRAGGALAGTQHPLQRDHLCSSSLTTRRRLPPGAPTGAARRCLLPTGTGLGPLNAARPAQHGHHSAAGQLCMMECRQLWEVWHHLAAAPAESHLHATCMLRSTAG